MGRCTGTWYNYNNDENGINIIQWISLHLTLYQTIPIFRIWGGSLLKTLLETEKMLVTGIVSFSYTVSTLSETNFNFFQSHLFCHLQKLSIRTSLKICWFVKCWPFPKRQILDSYKLKEFAKNNSKFDENGKKFSKRIENTVRKGEIARYRQFLLFLQSFQNTCTADTWIQGHW